MKFDWKIKRLLAFITVLACGFFIFAAYLNINGDGEKFIPESDILKQSLLIIENNYFDPNLINPRLMYVAALQQVSREVAPVLVNIKDPTTATSADIKVASKEMNLQLGPLKTIDQLNDKLQETLKFIKQNLNQVDFSDLAVIDYAAINGLLSTLDPHSSLLTPQVYKEFSDDTQGEYAGVGMVIKNENGKIKVNSVIGKDSPAKKAGIKAGDFIIEINGLSTAGMSVEDAKNKLRGLKNTSVKIRLERSKEKTDSYITLTRSEIKLPSVNYYEFKDGKNRYGFVRINRVIANSASELRASLSELGSDLNDFKGLILDLRNNPGGLLNQAIEISNVFLNQGIIVSIAGVAKKNIVNYRAKPYGTVKDFPVVILVNKFSASAAEIIAGALQKNNRALVVGETTFGKGTVQSLVEEFSDGSGLKITTSQYLTPGEQSIQSVGIVPTVHLQPLLLDKKNLMVLPANSRLEKSLDHSFSFGDATKSDSKYNLSYLSDDSSSDDDDVDDEAALDYGDIDPKIINKDYQVNFALGILKNSPSSYKAKNDKLGQLVTTEEATQNIKINKAFKELGVDWQNIGVAKNKASANFTINLERQVGNSFESISLDNPFPFDATGKLVLTAKNTSNRKLRQVIGKIESNSQIFNERQFAFGDMEANQAKSWSIPFKTQLYNSGSPAELTFKLQEYKSDSFLTQKKIINFTASEDLKLLASFSAPADAALFDGKNTISSKFSLRNDSKIDSGPISINIKNADIDSLKIGVGQILIKNIAPKESFSESIDLNSLQKPADGKFDFLFTVIPQNYINSAYELKLSLQNSNNEFQLVSAPPTIGFSSDSKISKSKNTTLQAKITDDNGLKDIYLYQGNNKIFYLRLVDAQKSYELKLPVDLSDSSDFLLVASDIYDMKYNDSLHVALVP